MRLHGYYRSSASYRVRIALNLKGVAYESIPHHLRHNEHHAPDFLQLNPQAMVPVLEAQGTKLTQSMAIIEYIDETVPEPALLPKGAADRAYVRGLAQMIGCDIHPIDNLRVLRYLRQNFSANEAAIGAWYNHWIAEGFAALEAVMASDQRTGDYCYGNAPTLADICLVPQMVNAANYKLNLSPYPKLQTIFANCMALPAFSAAHPSQQPDTE